MLSVRSLACVRGERCLFSDLSFDLDKGGLIHLIGSNGIGKSSLLRLLAGFSQPFAGEICWQGVDVQQDPGLYRQQLVFLPDQAPLKKQLTPDEHLAFWQKLLSTKGGRSADVGLSQVSDLSSKHLSSGQRRRTSFLLLSHDRPLWLLDEPFVGLDSQGVEMLLALIEKHRAQDGMVLLTSHISLELSKCQVLQLSDYAEEDIFV